jgi:hypothetical protein
LQQCGPIHLCADGFLLYPNLLDPDPDSDPDFDKGSANSITTPNREMIQNKSSLYGRER